MDFWSTISVKSLKSPTSTASYCFLDSCLFPQPATFEQAQFLSSHTYPSFSWASRRHSLLFPPREGSHQRQRSWHCIDLSTQKSNLKHFHVYSTLCWVVTFQQPLIEDRERAAYHWWGVQSCWRILWKGWEDQMQMWGCPTWFERKQVEINQW